MNVPKLGIRAAWEYTDDINKAEQWLKLLPGTFAADFEAASKYTREQKERFKELAERPGIDILTKRELLKKAESTALHHPSLVKVTHISLGIREDQARVIILKDDAITDLVMNFLVNTDKRQIWHNAGYDLKLVHYHTGKFPKVYEDTHQLAKTILNNVNRFLGKTDLKHLMGGYYGDWAIAKDNFQIENMYDEQLLKYAAIDGAATIKLWNELQNFVKEEKQQELLSEKEIIFPFDPSIEL